MDFVFKMSFTCSYQTRFSLLQDSLSFLAAPVAGIAQDMSFCLEVERSQAFITLTFAAGSDMIYKLFVDR